MPHGKIGIFVATMTGMAQFCAEEIDMALGEAGASCVVHLMDGLTAEALLPYEIFVIVSSTYGQGDIPDNGQQFFASLEAGSDLKGKHYAIFALGDRTFADTFCLAGEKWDAVLTACGAERLTPLECHDASGGTLAEDMAGGWARSWASLI